MLGRLGSFLLDILEVLVFSIAIFLFIYLLIFRPHKIKGASMQPNFPDGEYLLTEKVNYYFNEPTRGDVVVFKPPSAVTVDDEFIKRIIGLPGDKIAIIEGRVYLNDKPLEENYLANSLVTSGSSFLQEGKDYLVPEGKFFVMGDNRPNSSDSRAWGPITKKDISGRAWFVYWPPMLIGFVKQATFAQ